MSPLDALDNLKANLASQPGCSTIYAPAEAVRALVDAYEARVGLRTVPVVGETKVFALLGGAGLLVHDDAGWETVPLPPLPEGCSVEYAVDHFRRVADHLELRRAPRRSNINGAPLDADRGDPTPRKE